MSDEKNKMAAEATNSQVHAETSARTTHIAANNLLMSDEKNKIAAEATNSQVHAETSARTTHIAANNLLMSDEKNKIAAEPTNSQVHAEIPARTTNIAANNPSKESSQASRQAANQGQPTPAPYLTGSPVTQSVNTNKEDLSAPEELKLNQEKENLRKVLQETSPMAAQQVLRDMWRMFIFEGYNSDHISFIIRAGLKNSTVDVLERVFKDDLFFSESFQLVASRKPDIIRKVMMNAGPELLAGLLPPSTLNLIVEDTVKKAPATDLINWLAAGERLGFRHDDKVDELGELVFPNVQVSHVQIQTTNKGSTKRRVGPIQASQPSHKPKFQEQVHKSQSINPPPTHIPPREQAGNKAALAASEPVSVHAKPKDMMVNDSTGQRPQNNFMCEMCNQSAPTLAGFNFHVWRKVCLENKTSDGKWKCENCLSSFVGKQGLKYHEARQVCSYGRPQLFEGRSEPLRSEKVHTKPSSHLLNQKSSQQGPSPSRAIPRPPIHNVKMPQQVAPPSNKPDSYHPLQRPPMHTPKRKQLEPTKEIQDLSHVTPDQRVAMKYAIFKEDMRFQQEIANLPSNLTASERISTIASLQISSSTRKLMIKKAHGVNLGPRPEGEQAASPGAISRTHPVEDVSASREGVLLQGNNGANSSNFSDVVSYVSPAGRGSTLANGQARVSAPLSQYRPPSMVVDEQTHSSIPVQPHNPLKRPQEVLNDSGIGVLQPTSSTPAPSTTYQRNQASKRRRKALRNSLSTSNLNSLHLSQNQGQLFPSHGLITIDSEDATSKLSQKSPDRKHADNDVGDVSSKRSSTAGATTPMPVSVGIPTSKSEGIPVLYTMISSGEDEDPVPHSALKNRTHTALYTVISSSGEDDDVVQNSASKSARKNGKQGGASEQAKRSGDKTMANSLSPTKSPNSRRLGSKSNQVQ